MDFPEQVGTYRLVRELGRGSMGTVYLAHQESLGRDVALKLLAPEFTRDEEFVERFKREARIAARLRHPHIVQVYDASARDGHYYIAMEYLGSRTLRNWLVDCGGRLPVDEAIMLADHVLLALSHAHKEGVVHRDIKPANILITDKGEAALTDFSIAQIQAASRLTKSGAMMGTPEYMSPEQFEGQVVDARADLYAVGLVLYEMVTGVHPFRGETTPEVMRAHFYRRAADPTSLNPDVSMALSAVIRKALEKEPDLRFQDADAMLAALREAAGVGAAETGLQQFLAAVTKGNISLDEANAARELVKAAIDEGYRKTMTVMFLDLVGSSKVKLPDETLHADRAFRDYRASINNALQSYGCESFEWAGDGVICLFEQALPAVAAAVEIQGLVAQVAERHPDLPSQLKARIGINTGEVYMDPRRGLGEFASRTVDQAGHLEKDCPPGLIRVGESTMELTADQVGYEEVGVNRDGITVYTVVRGPQPRAATTRTFAPLAPPVEGFRPGHDVSRLVQPAATPLMVQEPDRGLDAPFVWEEREATLLGRVQEEEAWRREAPQFDLAPAGAAEPWVEGEGVSAEDWASSEGLPPVDHGVDADDWKADAPTEKVKVVQIQPLEPAAARPEPPAAATKTREMPAAELVRPERERAYVMPPEARPAAPAPAAPTVDQGPQATRRSLGLAAVAALFLAGVLAWPRPAPAPVKETPVETPVAVVTPAAIETPSAVKTPVAPGTPVAVVPPKPKPKPVRPAVTLSVRVTTVPASATVMLAGMDGQRLKGKAVSPKSAGRYKLIVQAPGYRPYRKVIQVKGEHKLQVRLEKEVVAAPAPAPAYVPPSSGGYYAPPSYSGGRHEIKAPDL